MYKINFYYVIFIIIIFSFLIRLDYIDKDYDFSYQESSDYFESQKPIKDIIFHNDKPIFTLYTKFLNIGGSSSWSLRMNMGIVFTFFLLFLSLSLQCFYKDYLLVILLCIFAFPKTMILISTMYSNLVFFLFFIPLQIYLLKKVLTKYKYIIFFYLLFLSLFIIQFSEVEQSYQVQESFKIIITDYYDGIIKYNDPILIMHDDKKVLTQFRFYSEEYNLNISNIFITNNTKGYITYAVSKKRVFNYTLYDNILFVTKSTIPSLLPYNHSMGFFKV